MLSGKTLTLEFDGWRVGDYSGRRYAYVYLPDKTFVNAELIRRGYGKPLEIPPNVAHAPELRRLASAARRAHLGLWSRC